MFFCGTQCCRTFSVLASSQKWWKISSFHIAIRMCVEEIYHMPSSVSNRTSIKPFHIDARLNCQAMIECQIYSNKLLVLITF